VANLGHRPRIHGTQNISTEGATHLWHHFGQGNPLALYRATNGDVG
jgi:hypothetical protein